MLGSIQKSEILAIAYSAVVKQILKISKSKADANKRLFNMYSNIYSGEKKSE